MQKPRPGHGHAWFLASCLVRGEGTTEGYHRAEIPVPPKARMALLSKQSRDSLGHLAEKQLADARAVQNALSTALALLAEGGPEKPDFERVKSARAAARRAFQRRWEADFFPGAVARRR
ncbi:MAG: hypothetical protein KatS3mg124_0822 [Porticoccaceae bacterium]|nr:MAG: hypothetical protein KatS3mg124_0822 [Porticoccaceae bacterium]